MKNATLLLAFLLLGHFTYAMQDAYFLSTYGNVQVRLYKFRGNGEVKRTEFIGMLVKELCNRTHYSKPVFIDLNSIGEERTSMYVLFDKGESLLEPHMPKKVNNKTDVLVVRGMMQHEGIPALLKLIEYGITNEECIRAAQQKRATSDNDLKFPIIDTAERNEIMRRPSKIVDEVMSTRLDETTEFRRGGTVAIKKKYRRYITYYFQNNKYHIYSDEFSGKDTALLKLDHVSLLYNVSPGEAFIFDSDSTFYYVNTSNGMCSAKVVLPDIAGKYDHVEVKRVEADKIQLFFRYFSMISGTHETSLFYTPATGALVEAPQVK